MPVASSIEADAADGNLDKWKGRIIIVDYTRYVNYINQTIAKKILLLTIYRLRKDLFYWNLFKHYLEFLTACAIMFIYFWIHIKMNVIDNMFSRSLSCTCLFSWFSASRTRISEADAPPTPQKFGHNWQKIILQNQAQKDSEITLNHQGCASFLL